MTDHVIGYVILTGLSLITVLTVWRAIFRPRWGEDEIATERFGGLNAHKWPWK